MGGAAAGRSAFPTCSARSERELAAMLHDLMSGYAPQATLSEFPRNDRYWGLADVERFSAGNDLQRLTHGGHGGPSIDTFPGAP